jgi:hypothetical protein
VFNIVDDEPAPASEWLPYLAACAGAKPPMRVARISIEVLRSATPDKLGHVGPGADARAVIREANQARRPAE